MQLNRQQKGKTLEVRRPMAGEVLPPIFKRVYWSELQQAEPVPATRTFDNSVLAARAVDPRTREIMGVGKSYER
jgi:hypothetical protein